VGVKSEDSENATSLREVAPNDPLKARDFMPSPPRYVFGIEKIHFSKKLDGSDEIRAI
jgi:hypothetical protein